MCSLAVTGATRILNPRIVSVRYIAGHVLRGLIRFNFTRFTRRILRGVESLNVDLYHIVGRQLRRTRHVLAGRDTVVAVAQVTGSGEK